MAKLPRILNPADPVELLSRERFVELLAWAETTYDLVLIDCPPIVAASDAAIIGRVVDSLLLVVQPAKNHRRLVIRAMESLLTVGVQINGVVVNHVSPKVDSGYDGYGFNYGYGRAYGYGEGDPDDEPQWDLTHRQAA